MTAVRIAGTRWNPTLKRTSGAPSRRSGSRQYGILESPPDRFQRRNPTRLSSSRRSPSRKSALGALDWPGIPLVG